MAAAELKAAGLSLATAESLTGGLLGSLLTSVPGVSACYRGGVIAYATEAKAHVLGVPADLLAAHGPVSVECARAMAEGTRRLFGADFGLATTGVAGPDTQDGHPVGTLFLGLAGPAGVTHAGLFSPAPGRNEIREWAAEEAFRLLLTALPGYSG